MARKDTQGHRLKCHARRSSRVFSRQRICDIEISREYTDPSDSVDLSYLLMECLPGKPYYINDASEEQNRQVFGQVEDSVIKLSLHPCDKAGSLSVRDGKIGVLARASDPFGSLGQHGPYDTLNEYFFEMANEHLNLIVDGRWTAEPPISERSLSFLQDYAARGSSDPRRHLWR